MDECIFCRIAAGSIPSRKIYEDDLCFCFHDIQPQAPTHALLIPKRHISSLQDLTPDDQALVGHMMGLMPSIAQTLGVDREGYRIAVNVGTHGRQSVRHLHLHILGGRQLGETMG